MMSSSAIHDSPPLCVHSNHLFAHPLCQSQTLLRKIANIAFHILTIGIPLAVYNIISCIFPSSQADYEENSHIQKIIREGKMIPSTPQEAMKYSSKQLKNNPDISEFKFFAGCLEPLETHQPANPDISKLTTLWNSCTKKFEGVLRLNSVNTWSSKEVLKTADALMKLGYAISTLTLEDLESFTERLSSAGEERTYAEALTIQDSYQYRTFFFCTMAYHWIRSAIVWVDDPEREREGLSVSTPIPVSHENAFYQPGTVQNSWKIMYNHYCDLVRTHVNETDLGAKDGRHINWTQKDTGFETFRAVPDTLPT